MACKVQVVADSTTNHGVRITSVQLRYWRAIHAELMTHRVFSRNASSSRAIPVMKVLAQVWSDPAGPIHWGANRPGMQAKEELTGWRKKAAQFLWRSAGKVACVFAYGFIKIGLHKQVANRILEPWQYINVLVTATEWDNFFALRRHEDAQPEIHELADAIHFAMERSSPMYLNPGEWHIPYVPDNEWAPLDNAGAVKVSTARNARTSYLTHDGKPTEMAADIALHDKLVIAEPLHASPAEHPAMAMEHEDWCRNFRGWRQYRDFLEAGEEVK